MVRGAARGPKTPAPGRKAAGVVPRGKVLSLTAASSTDKQPRKQAKGPLARRLLPASKAKLDKRTAEKRPLRWASGQIQRSPVQRESGDKDQDDKHPAPSQGRCQLSRRKKRARGEALADDSEAIAKAPDDRKGTGRGRRRATAEGLAEDSKAIAEASDRKGTGRGRRRATAEDSAKAPTAVGDTAEDSAKAPTAVGDTAIGRIFGLGEDNRKRSKAKAFAVDDSDSGFEIEIIASADNNKGAVPDSDDDMQIDSFAQKVTGGRCESLSKLMKDRAKGTAKRQRLQPEPKSAAASSRSQGSERKKLQPQPSTAAASRSQGSGGEAGHLNLDNPVELLDKILDKLMVVFHHEEWEEIRSFLQAMFDLFPVAQAVAPFYAEDEAPVGTACAGTDGIIPLLQRLGQRIGVNFTHKWSCEKDRDKRAYLKEVFPGLHKVFADVRFCWV